MVLTVELPLFWDYIGLASLKPQWELRLMYSRLIIIIIIIIIIIRSLKYIKSRVEAVVSSLAFH